MRLSLIHCVFASLHVALGLVAIKWQQNLYNAETLLFNTSPTMSLKINTETLKSIHIKD